MEIVKTINFCYIHRKWIWKGQFYTFCPLMSRHMKGIHIRSPVLF